MKKPLKVMLFNPSSKVWDIDWESMFLSTLEPRIIGLDFYPLICISVSRIQTDDDTDYIQGAGDDEEAWSMVRHLVTNNFFQGLTYTMFWENIEEIMESGSNVQDCIQELKQRYELDLKNSSVSLPQQSLTIDELRSNFHFIGNSKIAIGNHPSGSFLLLKFDL
jgi:hypothetical protein